MVWFPPAMFVAAWLLALLGIDPPGAGESPPFDEMLLLWVLYLSAGWVAIGAAISHTILAKSTAKGIGWETSGFQHEVGFANLGIGLAAIYAVHSGTPDAWVAAAIAAGTFATLAGINHVRDMVKRRNFKPGNSVILIQDFGKPATLLVTLISTGTI